ncbi:chorismate mutase [Holzapfeliella sp. JNUCC 72]
MSHRKLKTSLFLNYLVHGMALIILAQNIKELGANWGTPLATASYVLSGVGIGRLGAYLILGYLSDRIGRKKVLILGMMAYFTFFMATPFNHNITLSYGLSILAGVANSAFDSATYPTFLEIGDKNKFASILLKAFISVGEFILPLVVASLHSSNLWFGWSFVLAAVIVLINFVTILTTRFPKQQSVIEEEVSDQSSLSKNKKRLVAILLGIYSYTSMAIMIWFTQWISLFATDILHYDSLTSHTLISLYSLGSIIGVLTVFLLLKQQFSATRLLVIMNVVSLLSLIVITQVQQPTISMISAFLFGFSAASGVMQIGLNLLIQLFPKNKGILTGIYFMFGSVASFTVPIITGKLSQFGIQTALQGDILVGVIGTIAVAGIFIIYKTVQQPDDLASSRQKINQIDQQIIGLLQQRFEAVTAVSEAKRQTSKPVFDPKREQQVLAKIDNYSQVKSLAPHFKKIYQGIMDASKDYQNELNKVGGKK